MDTLLLIVGIAAIAAVAFEFLLGVSGRAKLEDWVLRQWVRFEDMRLSEFATSEAAFCVSLSDRVFGAKLWCWRRLFSCLGIEIALLTFWLTAAHSEYPGILTAVAGYSRVDLLFDIVTNVVLMMTAVSLTRWISARALAYTFGSKAGILPFVALLGLHILLFFAWRPIADYLHDVLTDYVLQLISDAVTGRYDRFEYGTFKGMAHLFDFHWQRAMSWPAPDLRFSEFGDKRTANGSVFLVLVAVRQTTSIFFSSLRVAFALGVLLTFFFRRVIVRFVSLLWRRVIEDGRGACTLIVGGVAAVVTLLKEVLAHF
jgi:hypothetical protein